ncbi:MAG: CRISPR system precrRNA processing endoribonuclease RAMP protein Cas6 [Candidatus Solibacter usitatus]|nr:CRISPR system precrRNA processing endoribonuclease RAMP protein Cas6 [Candidatus Solibacter usitatus]
MNFAFFRLRLHFRAAEPVRFPPGKAGNILRGAFGTALRGVACVPECTAAATCPLRATCAYSRLFEPRAARAGPSGLVDWPRPFVFRAAHLDGRRFEAGQPFHFDAHLFDLADPGVTAITASFACLAQEGIGPGRGRSELVAAEMIDLDCAAAAQPITLSLDRGAENVSRILVRFVTPTELKSAGSPQSHPTFATLFARVRDRISTLRALYGPGPLAIDFHAMGERAKRVKMPRCELQWQHVERRSSRSGQSHPLGGFVGEVEYEGDLAEFLPYLRAAQWTGAGRQTVWGKGEIATRVVATS